ncbi:WD repeat-containing protein 78 [Allomyces arbusculus]|nr:WD repeat-containing protein 78 [Allomyces arbusculus]
MKSTRKHLGTGTGGTVSGAHALGGASYYNASRRTGARGSQMLLHTGAVGGPGTGSGRAADVRYVDAHGNDVTPQPLLPPPKPVPGNKVVGASAATVDGAGMSVGGGGSRMVPSSALDYFASLEAQTLNQFSSLNFGKSYSSFANGGGSKMSASSTNEDRSEDETASMTSERSADDDDGYNTRFKDAQGRKRDAAAAPSKVPELSETDLNRTIHLTLCESDIVWLLDLPSISVAPDDSDVAAVEEANARYQQLLASRMSDNNFVHRSSQTYNSATKTKDIQAVLVKPASAETQVTEWAIYDAYQELAPVEEAGMDNVLNTANKSSISSEALPALTGAVSSMQGTMASVLDSSSFISSALSTMETSQVGGGDGQSSVFGAPNNNANVQDMVVPSYLEKDVTLQSLNQDRLKESLRIMELAVLEANYGPRLLEYRDIDIPVPGSTTANHDGAAAALPAPTITDTFESHIPSLHYLWSFRCEHVRDRPVAAIAWNKHNPDVLAVGYGPMHVAAGAPAATAMAASSPGMICCWSLKNPEFPARTYRCASSVTAIDFSRASPSLLAVGFLDGRIAIYDVRDETTTGPVVDSTAGAGTHRDPVWQVAWVDKEQSIGDQQIGRSESVVSISTDGRVCQWLLRKGLECVELMTLKTVKGEGGKAASASSGGKANGAAPSSGGGGGGVASFISRSAGGLSFDFHPTDYNCYLVATEDGTAHKCSVSYNEQYLATYTGHAGPIHRIKWSPFSPHIFATASADWSVGLWHQDRESMGLKFYSGKDAIMDVDWSPHSPTVLASVAQDGRIEVWDLAVSVLDPTIVHAVLDQRLRCCAFSPSAPVLVTGDDAGAVNVYRLRRMQLFGTHGEPTAEELAALAERTTVLETLVQANKGAGAVAAASATTNGGVGGGAAPAGRAAEGGLVR